MCMIGDRKQNKIAIPSNFLIFRASKDDSTVDKGETCFDSYVIRL